MTFTVTDRYAIQDGQKAISKTYDNGCTLFGYWDGQKYAKFSEDVADVLVAAFYPIREAMREFLNNAELVSWCGKSARMLQSECLTAWGRLEDEQ